MMTQVPRLFDMIRLLFQSIRRSVITKEELIYKLLAGNLEIIDRSKHLLHNFCQFSIDCLNVSHSEIVLLVYFYS